MNSIVYFRSVHRVWDPENKGNHGRAMSWGGGGEVVGGQGVLCNLNFIFLNFLFHYSRMNKHDEGKKLKGGVKA